MLFKGRITLKLLLAFISHTGMVCKKIIAYIYSVFSLLGM